MAGLRDLKRRIRSIGSTRKITRALQLVSAAKMRKAQAAVLASRAYSALAWEIIGNLSQKVAFELPLLKRHPEAKKIGVLLLGTNRGMVGSLNSNLALKIVEIGEPEVVMEMAVFGRQAKSLALRAEKNITADFPKPEKHPSAADVHPLVKYIVDLYETGEYRKIVVVYNHFVSTLVQKPTAKQLLPFSPVNSPAAAGSRPAEDSDVLLEPDPLTVLNHLIPRIIESQIYQTILESEASEHSARMVMMKNATEAAGELISDLTLAYNQLRQNKITTELSEITAGRIALE